MAESSSQPQFHFSSVPGRKFSMTTSDFRTKSLKRLWPSGCRRSSVMAFLLRPMTGHHTEGCAARLRAPMAHGIALAGRLDLDDLGAHVAEQLPAEGTCDERAELEHSKVGERAA